MLISTMNDLPGYRIDEVLGEVFGLTVRSRGMKGQLGASFKSVFGGELGSLTQMLHEGREEGIQRLVEEAESKGANAIIAMRFDTSEMMDMGTEICAYGTACKVTKALSRARGVAQARRKIRAASCPPKPKPVDIT